MAPAFRILSLGALESNHLWKEGKQSRTGHTTTSLIKSENQLIIVNPGLPPSILIARMNERTNIKPSDITDLFLTRFDLDHMRGIEAFPNARRYLFSIELESCTSFLENEKNTHSLDNNQTASKLNLMLNTIKTFSPAPESFAPGIDLFPTPGVSIGHCSLLLAGRQTTIVAGDAVATEEHLYSKSILPTVENRMSALESLNEIVEISDTLITGRGNWVIAH
tara:strand:+ start:838 stop:1503 length:666 start_codon:yes stop_codon:yes gene_type:complete